MAEPSVEISAILALVFCSQLGVLAPQLQVLLQLTRLRFAYIILIHANLRKETPDINIWCFLSIRLTGHVLMVAPHRTDWPNACSTIRSAAKATVTCLSVYWRQLEKIHIRVMFAVCEWHMQSNPSLDS